MTRPLGVLRRLVLVFAFGLVLGPAAASAHPVLTAAVPAPDSRDNSSPRTVVLDFNEPIELLPGASDIDVVSSSGAPVQSGPAGVDPDKTTRIVIPIRPGVAAGTYTVRYRIIGADSHVVGGAYIFGVGPGALGEPYLRDPGGSGGPTSTSPWMVAARFLELVGLGGLFGLVATRIVVWRPMWLRAGGIDPSERAACLVWGRDRFWFGFGVLAILAMLATGGTLIVQAAATLGSGVLSTAGDSEGIRLVLSDTRVGELIQLRAALLFLVFAAAAWLCLDETAGRTTGPGGGPGLAVVGGLLLSAIGVVAYQGHASQAPLPILQVSIETVHVAAAGAWAAGLAAAAVAVVRLPRVAGKGGAAAAGQLLLRFSRVAFGLVALIVVTGIVRTSAELDAPEQLWETAYGRSVLLKVGILILILAVAMSSRRIVLAIAGQGWPASPRALALIPPRAAIEVTLMLVTVVVASVLAGQVPGRL